MITTNLVDVAALGKLRLYETYRRYDGPRIFSSISDMDHLFFCLLVEEYLPDDDSAERPYDVFFATEVTRDRLREIKNGRIGVNDAFRRSENARVWRAKVDYVPLKFEVETLQSSAVESILGEIHEQYLDYVESRLAPLDLAEIAALAVREHRTFGVLELASLHGNEPEAALLDVAEFLSAAQKVINYAAQVAEGNFSNAGRVPARIADDTELRLAGLRAGSLAFVVSEARRPGTQLPMIPNGTLSKALTSISDLMDTGQKDPERLHVMLGQMNKRLINGYVSFLETVKSVADGFTMVVAEFDGSKTYAKIEGRGIVESIDIGKSVLGVEKEDISIFGILVGFNARSKRFEVLDETGLSYAGWAIAEPSVPFHNLVIEAPYDFILQCERYKTEVGVQRTKWYLLAAQARSPSEP